MSVTGPTEKWLQNDRILRKFRTIVTYWVTNKSKFCVEFYDSAALDTCVAYGYGDTIPEAYADACNDLMRRS